MRIFAVAAFALLAGCAGAGSSQTAIPAMPALHGPVPGAIQRGIYVSQFSSTAVYGYAGQNRRNAPPICGEGGLQSVADVAADPEGNMIVPDGFPHSVYVSAGPRMCGTATDINDPYGQPVDAASANAMTGTIVVANVFDDGPVSDPPPGTLSLCTIAKGCTTNLGNPQMNEVAAVALDKSGDCWASAVNASNVPTLTYFAKCTGAGVAATGYENASYGGLEVDTRGRLLAIDSHNAQLYVYSGCKPACETVAGPLPLHGTSIYGKLDKSGKSFAAADYETGEVDIYRYTGTALTYEFSFEQDLNEGMGVEGVAYTPAL